MGIHTIKFISEIQKRPCLWNNNLENYSGNKLAKQQAWDEVAQIMFDNWSSMDATNRTEKLREIQKKWKGLRDYFARARNKGPKNKDETDRRKRRKAPSLKLLQFLNITKQDDGAPLEPESEDSDTSLSFSGTKPRKIHVNIETEQLITEVHNKPCIWNYNSPEYNDKEIKQQAWMEIGVNLYDDFLTLSERNKREIVRHMQKKWKGLRDYFTRQKTKERINKGEKPLRKRKAPFLTMLQFLDIPKPCDEDSLSKADNITEQNDTMTQGADSDVSQSSFSWPREKPSTGKRPKSSPHRSFAETTSVDKRTDPDMNFLLNILPDMKSMTQRQNFDFRFEVMKLIKNIKYNQPTEYYYSNGPGTSGQNQEVPVHFSWHTSSTESKPSGKPPFRHQVIIHEYPRNTDGADLQSPLSNESAGSSVEDIKAILRESSDEQISQFVYSYKM